MSSPKYFFRKIPKRWQQRHHHLLATTAFADTGTDVAVTAAATSRRASSKRPNKNYSLLIHGPPGFIFPKNKARNQRPYKLVIVESPSKCQTINKILQGYVEEHDLKYDFVISSSMGKLRLLLFCDPSLPTISAVTILFHSLNFVSLLLASIVN